MSCNQIDAKTKDIEIEELKRCILETKQELLYEVSIVQENLENLDLILLKKKN